jgi:hypothetical protein
MKEAKERRRRPGRLLERDWSELIGELLGGLIRLVNRPGLTVIPWGKRRPDVRPEPAWPAFK